MSTDVTEPFRMNLTRPIQYYTNLDLIREIKKIFKVTYSGFCKNKDHKRLDNCDILKKYAGIAIGYILEIRSNPRKLTVFLNSACKMGPESVGKPLTFLKRS